MAQEKPNRMAEWVMLLRKNAPVAMDYAQKWLGQVREDPHLLWETPAVRYFTYGVGAIVLSWFLMFFVRIFTPPAPVGAKDPAVTADYHVVCSDPTCEYNFIITREFGFDRFPVLCDRCRKETGMPGRRCYSSKCQGRWVAPVAKNERQECPRCGAVFP